MAFIAQSRRNKFWFGTEQKMSFFPTPNRGADVSPAGWEAGGLLLNGGGYQLNSFGSHKNYMFEWPESSSREVAQKMKSYADGSFGRGLIYFLDPLTWSTNVLPAMWADPSMGVGYEGASLVYGVEATGLPTSGGDDNELPVTSAYYDLSTVAAGWRGKEDAVFIPIPEGYTLALGSIHAQSGTGRVFYREQATNGALGAITALAPIAAGAGQIVNTFVSGASLAGIWLYIGKTNASAGSVTLTAMTGRIIESAKTQSTFITRNEFTNPNLKGGGTWAEVRRNYSTNPSFESAVWPTQSGVETLLNDTRSRFGDRSMRLSRDTSGAINVFRSPGSSATWAVAPGEQWGISYYVFSPKPAQFRVQARWQTGTAWGTGITSNVGPVIDVPANEWTRVEGVLTVPATATYAQEGVFSVTSFSAGEPVWIDGFQVERDQVTPYFDGSMPDRSVDPDMRTRTLASGESVMEIERVAGIAESNAIAGRSTWEGKPAVRVIKISNAIDSYARFELPMEARPAGMALGTLNIAEPISATGASYIRRLRVQPPVQMTDEAPNEPGSYPMRLAYSGQGPGSFILLGHGGRLGDPDVWWTDIGLFEGNYTGPVFSGDSSGLVINGRNVRTQWDGEPNNSTSSAWTMTPELDKLEQGPWVGGQGHSGCRFIGKPTYMNNTGVEGGQVSFAASFREVGSWANG